MKASIRTLVVTLLLAMMPSVLAGEININTATAEELASELKGVGLNKAKAIVAYREQHGLFNSPDELSSVKGIGLRTVDLNRDSIKYEVDDAQ